MKRQRDDIQLRETGRGFIVCTQGTLAGRRLTRTYVDQNNQTYVKVDGEFELLTKQHNYLAVD